MRLDERLSKLLSYDVRSILKDTELRNEYIELHLELEGYAPSCTGCSAKSRLLSWKQKNFKARQTVIKNQNIMSNTFKLKKEHPRLSVPFSRSVITQSSSDDLVLFYINQASSEEEKKRRESFFEVLPEQKTKPKKKTEDPVKEDAPQNVITDLEAATTRYNDVFNKEVPNRYKNNLKWILNRIGQE